MDRATSDDAFVSMAAAVTAAFYLLTGGKILTPTTTTTLHPVRSVAAKIAL